MAGERPAAPAAKAAVAAQAEAREEEAEATTEALEAEGHTARNRPQTSGCGWNSCHSR